MQKMELSLLIAILISVICGGAFAANADPGDVSALAADPGSMTQTVVDTFALLFLLFGAYIAWELYNIMTGGQLATSWGLMSGAVVIFALIKIIEVAERARYFPVPDWVLSIGYFFVSLFLFLGFLRQRKTLG